MIPKNITLFRFSVETAQLVGQLLSLRIALEQEPFQEPGATDLNSYGFVPVAGEHYTAKASVYESFALRIADKILPSASVREAVAKRAKAIEVAEGRKVGGRERKRLKENVLNEMLPHAPIKYTTIGGWLDYRGGWLIVGTASRKQAELVVSALRNALGSFPATMLAPEHTPSSVLTDWVTLHSETSYFPDDYEFGDEVTLQAADKAKATYRNQQIDGNDEILQNLTSGKRVIRIGLYHDRYSFVLDENLTLRKFKLSDVVLDEHAESEQVGAEADLLLAATEVSAITTVLADAFKIARPE